MTSPTGSDPHERVIDLSVEVAGSTDDVWRAVATGPGISSWYVPTTVDEREGGAVTQRFGEGPDMLVHGRVAAWEPPRRVVFDAGEGVPGLVFEWIVEGGADAACVVRLINRGFVVGTPWDDQYDGMSEGWTLFLDNLRLHLEHFRGQTAVAMLPMAMWPLPRVDAWTELTTALGIPAAPRPGDHIATTLADGPALAGTVVDVEPWRLSLLLDAPAPGTAFLACEGIGEQTGVSVWQYLYGDEADRLVTRDRPRWQAWLDRRAGSTDPV